MQRDYDENCGVNSDPDKASMEGSADGESLVELLEQEWLWGQAAVAEKMLGEAFALARQLIQAVSCTVPIAKNGYLELLRGLASDLQTLRRAATAMIEQLADWEVKLSELVLKAQLLAEVAWRAGDLQTYLDAEVGELESAKRTLEFKESALQEKRCEKDHLEIELGRPELRMVEGRG